MRKRLDVIKKRNIKNTELLDELNAYVNSKEGVLQEKEWFGSKYKYTIKCKNENHPSFKSSQANLVRGKRWCPYCSGHKGDFNSNLKQMIESKNGEMLSDYINAHTFVKVKCLEHNHIWEATPNNIKNGKWCYVCSMGRNEKIVWDYLTNNNYKLIPQFKFEENKYKFDFAIFNRDTIKFIIEVDDRNHWGNSISREKIKENDIVKNNYCTINSIPLLRIRVFRTNNFKYNTWYYNYIHEKITEFSSKL